MTREVLWAVELMQIPALGLVKLSLLFFYRRIFSIGRGKVFNAITVGMISVITIWTIGFFFGFLFICGSHFTAYWSSLASEKVYCVNTMFLHNWYAISDVITDIIVLIIPLPLIWQLHMTTGRKLAVIAIFSLGILTVAASITRMVIFVESTAVLHKPGIDVNLLTTGGIYWSMIESGLGLSAACLPAVYALLKTKGVESIVRSVQSLTSLRSLSSQRSQQRARPDPFSEEARQRNDSTASDVQIVSAVEGSTKGDKYMELEPIPSHNEVWVTRTITSAEKMV